MVSVLDFALTGRLNDIGLGDDKAMFCRKLGQPTWWEGLPSIDADQSSLWKYGPIQVVFDSGSEAVSIAINFDDEGSEHLATDDIPKQRIASRD